MMNLFGALAPLYLLGLAAISFPLIFHLIRRTPSGEQTFSSLMFLSPSPPRLTRRSRLDNILLLILRALALGLLAFAFTRPLLRQGLELDLSGVRSRQVAIVVDCSASMRREGIWADVEQEVEEIIDGLDEGDQVALFAYDDQLKTLVDFDDRLPRLEDQTRNVMAAFDELEPRWHATNLPGSLLQVADLVQATSLQKTSDKSPLSQVYLISDMQPGRDLVELQASEWPESIWVDVCSVEPQETSNAGIRVLYGDEAARLHEDLVPRVRISNAAGAKAQQFSVHQVGLGGRLSPGTSHYVPSGETRVIQVKQDLPEEQETIAFRLVGDDDLFDNDFYLPRANQEVQRVVFVGLGSREASDSLAYFLQGSLIDSRQRRFEVTEWDADKLFPAADDPATTPESIPDWVVVGIGLPKSTRESLLEYLESGGRALCVMQPNFPAEDVSDYLGAKIDVSEADPNGFALVGSIDFEHPVFRPFADPRFSNFTGIRFWHHRVLNLPDDSVLADKEIGVVARFDDGSPLLIQRAIGNGSLSLLTASWTVEQSQLALSTKFLPMIAGLADDRSRERKLLNYKVGDSIPLPESSLPVEVHRPNGDVIEMLPEESEFRDTSEPGRYRVVSDEIDYVVAINVDSRESSTEPLAADELESCGIPLGVHPDRQEQVAWERELQDQELENRQKMWLWLILGTSLFVVTEMAIAGRIQARRNQAELGVEATAS